MSRKEKVVFTVKFDLVQNLTDLTNLDAEDLKKYKENKDGTIINHKFREVRNEAFK